jgi:signal transduction histidine kinase
VRRLHLQIFRALVLTGLLCLGLTSAIAWTFSAPKHRLPRFVEDVGAFIVADLPESEPRVFREQLEQRARKLHASISVWNREGRLVARVGKQLGPARLPTRERGFLEHADGNVRLRLEDGRTLGISFDQQPGAWGPARFVGLLGLLLGTLLLGSYLAARRITRRLERLELGVTSFGEGNLDERVPVRGRDEIARLARAFNRSFDRIAGLLKQQRRMLQSASHELRSPLARVRMALELATEPALTNEAREQLRNEATRDIEELDLLIGDLLLAGRLADTELPRDFAVVPFHALVESEAHRIGARCELEPAHVHGNLRMLRSLVRNLLENARRHGKDPVYASCKVVDGQLALRVQDAGQGVPASERERIFEPFYRPAGHREGKDGGVGLGLSLVKTIAGHHGGDVRYVPCEVGSCFEVRLPLAPRERG